MKITAFLLLVCCLHVTAKIRSQTISFSGKDVPLETIFTTIKKQSDFLIVYNKHILKHCKPVSVDVKDIPLADFLQLTLANQGISFLIENRTIILKLAPAVAPDLSSRPNSPPIKISGTVYGLNKQPLPDATVRIKGKNIITTTDNHGYFELNADENSILIISYVGFYEKSVRAGSASINIQLEQVNNQMDTAEVVVNTGYEKLPRERATGSFEYINTKEFNEQISTDILSRLQGMSSSVLIDRRTLSPSGNSITNDQVMIRGLSTVTQTLKAPLIIVNNFPYEGDISNINPNDVESITILKDAAAASIWGARAGNGVIVITTKKGKYKQPIRLTLTSNIKVTEKPNLFYYPSMSSSDYIDVERFLYTQGYFNDVIDPANASRPGISPVVEILAQQKDGVIDETKANELIDALRRQDVRSDFSKYMYRTASNQQYAVNLAGGTENIRYALSAGYDGVQGALVGNENNRITLRSDNSFMPVKNFEIDFAVGVTSAGSTNNAIGEVGSTAYNIAVYPARSLYPYAALADANGNALAIPHNYRLSYLRSLNVPGLLDWEYRPLDEIRNADNKNITRDLLLNAGIKYSFLKAFNAQVQYQYEKSMVTVRNFYSEQTFFARDMINLFSSAGAGQLVYNVPRGGIIYTNPAELTSHAIRGQLNYDKTINGQHQFVMLAGAEMREKVSESTFYAQYGYNEETEFTTPVNHATLYPLFNGMGDGMGMIIGNSGLSRITDRFVSFFANGSYTFDNRIIFSASARRDASNLFGVETNNKWKPLWSAGTSWNISNEKFYQSKLFPYLKLRATYGFTGNVNNALSRYTTLSRYASFESYINEPFAGLNASGDPSLRWESVSTLNLAVDFKTKKSTISGSLEWYRKFADDLIAGAILDPVTGLGAVRKNSASLLTHGFQADINTINFNRSFKWTSHLAFNYTATKTKDYKLGNNRGSVQGIIIGRNLLFLYREKDPYGIYSLPFAGLDPASGDPLGYLGGKTSKNYRDIVQQAIDTANIIYHGSALPLFYGFLNNTFSYKRFSLAVNIIYQFDYYFRRNALSYTELFNLGIPQPDFARRWQKSGDETITTVPSMVYPLEGEFRDLFYAGSSANVLKGDNVRVQYIRLNYSLIKPNIQLSIIGSELGFIWQANKEKLDPDFGASPVQYPVPKSFTIGIQVGI